MVVGFIRGSLGSLGFALGVVRLIQGCWVHYDAPRLSLGSSGVVGVIRSHRVHSDYNWVSLCSYGVVGFTRGRPGGR